LLHFVLDLGHVSTGERVVVVVTGDGATTERRRERESGGSSSGKGASGTEGDTFRLCPRVLPIAFFYIHSYSLIR
jgi:hypothetical protein